MNASTYIMLILALLISGSLSAQKYASVEGKPIFDGNDLVSYYHGTVKKGKPEYTKEYDGQTLYFSNQENLDLFNAAPKKYMPEFGGWCATAMSMNTKLIPNYNFYKIEEGKLLFFAIQAFLNARTLWERDTVTSYKNAVINYDFIAANEN